MKLAMAMLTVVVLLAPGLATEDADDQWIAQCVQDNKGKAAWILLMLRP